MSVYRTIAARLYEYHTVVRFRPQSRQQNRTTHDIMAPRRIHKEFPDIIMVLFHVEHLFLDGIPRELRYSGQDSTCRSSAGMGIQCDKLLAVLIHACTSLNVLMSIGLMSSSSEPVIIWDAQCPILAG